MLVPIKWLKDYVDIDINSKDFADKLTMSGSHVDGIEVVGRDVKKIVVGKIEKIEQHPDADRLKVTQVNVGEEELIQVVTNATNVKVGDIVPVALVGAILSDGMKIKKGKLRGVLSQGMFCSTDEIGISADVVQKEVRDGVWVLGENFELGKDIKEVLGLDEETIEFEITPNRPDCLSMIGMARETAATLDIDLKMPEIKIEKEDGDIKDFVSNIEVKDADLCSRYCGRVIKDVRIEPSPLWMQTKLMQAGVRPTNNIVDVTNYVMLEMGQPLHAFDLDNLEGKQIIVRRAQEGETVTTLDDVERKLTNDNLVIADAKKPVAIAGVMGGGNSEVSDETKTILLESANFDGRSVRLTSRAVSLRTEASAKFEKDIDPELVRIACDRACQLIEMINAGTVVGGVIDIYENKREEKKLELRPESVNKLLGTKIETDFMVKALNRLELKAELKSDVIEVVVPSFRQDINMEADLIEEVGRIHGFHNITPTRMIGTLTRGVKSRGRRVEDKVKETLTGLGLNEVTTYSFISPKAYDKINLSEHSMKRNGVSIINPLGEDYSVMRTTMIPNMLEVLSRNYKYGTKRAWAYETGNVFIPQSVPVVSLPYEVKTVCMGMYGGEVDFFDLKGIVESVLETLGITGYEFEAEKNSPTFHPGRTANIIKNNHVIGTIGEIHPEVNKNYGLKERVYVAELDLDIMSFVTKMSRKYKELPKYPAITRDIAMLLNKEVLAKDIEKTIWTNGGDLVEKVELFDMYTGSQIPEDKKSMAYSIVYRSYEGTLKDEDIAPTHEKILEALSTTLGAELRK